MEEERVLREGKGESSHMTKQTWIWSLSNHVTKVWTVASMCFLFSSSIMQYCMLSKYFERTKQGLRVHNTVTNGPANLYFWSISRKRSLEYQEKHALRNIILRTLLCSNDISNPWYNWKMLIRYKKSFPEKSCFIYDQLFHPIQCTACRICQWSSIDKLILSIKTVVLSTSDQPHFLWGKKCFGTGTRQNSTYLYQSWCLHILFSYNYILSIHFRQEYPPLETVFSMFGKCCISTTVSVSFLEL